MIDSTPCDPEFADLHDRYRGPLLRHCARLLHPRHHAEDAVQETLLRAWRGRDGLRSEDATRAWLYRIATNVCIDMLSGLRRERETLGATTESVADDEPQPDAELAARETVELAYLAAIQLLPARQHSVLVLREVLGHSAKETAELLESSVASVNSAGQRARRTLRENLPEQRLEWAPDAQPSVSDRQLLRRYLDATERGDAEAVVDALRDRASFRMPAAMRERARIAEQTR